MDDTRRALLRSWLTKAASDIHACIAYGAEMSRERYVIVPLESAA